MAIPAPDNTSIYRINYSIRREDGYYGAMNLSDLGVDWPNSVGIRRDGEKLIVTASGGGPLGDVVPWGAVFGYDFRAQAQSLGRGQFQHRVVGDNTKWRVYLEATDVLALVAGERVRFEIPGNANDWLIGTVATTSSLSSSPGATLLLDLTNVTMGSGFNTAVNSGWTIYRLGNVLDQVWSGSDFGGLGTPMSPLTLADSVLAANPTGTDGADLTRITIRGVNYNLAGGGGLATVASDSTLTGDGSAGSPLSVANPFTAAEDTKLAGIATGAEVNPAQVSNAERTAGTETSERSFSPADIVSMIGTHGETGDITAVVAGTGLSGGGTSGSVTLNVENPFTDSYKAKLDGVEYGAQANRRHVALPFRTEDGNTVLAGITRFYESDNSQWQSGSSTEIAAIEIHHTQYTLTQNPQTANAAYTGWHELADDLIENGGMSIWTFQRLDNNDPNTQIAGDIIRVQVDNLSKNNNGNYVLGTLTHLAGFSTSGSGYSWQVVSVFAPPTGADSVIGVLGKGQLPGDVVYTEQLEGKEIDRYASYTNGIFASGDRRGSVCLFNQATEPTDDTNAIGQPDIADRNTEGTLVFGARLRTDRNPNNFVVSGSDDFSNLPNGTVFYISIWNKPSARLRFTTTGFYGQAGLGNARVFIYKGTWDEVEDISNVTQDGDYMRITDYEPADIDLRIPTKDVVGGDGRWFRVDGTNVEQATKDAIQGDNETVKLGAQFRVDVTNVDYYVSFSSVGGVPVVRVRIPWGSTPTQTAQQISADLARLLKPGAWLQIGDFTMDITTNYTLATIGTSRTFTANYAVVGDGTVPTGSALRDGYVVGEDVHRGQIARQGFKEESPSIAGKGGTAGQIWTRGSGDYNADWADAADGLPDQSGHGGEFLTTDGTDASWAEVSALNFYDSGEQSVSGNETVTDTETITTPTFTQTGVVETETITGFGLVYKTSALKSVAFTYDFNATQGVAYRLRYSDTKPTASDDAKNFGTEVRQVNANTETTDTIYDSPANRYYFFTLSGGGSRIVNKREVRMRAAYLGGGGGGGGDITGVAAGDGLTGGGVSGDVSLAVDAHTGITVNADGVSVTNPFTDSDETKLDGIATGAEVNPDPVTSTERTAGTEAGERSFSPADIVSMIGTHERFTATDETKLDGIATGAQVNRAIATTTQLNTGTDNTTVVTPAGLRGQVGAQVSSAEKTAGTEVGVRRFSPKDVHDMVDTHGGGGGGGGSSFSADTITEQTPTTPDDGDLQLIATVVGQWSGNDEPSGAGAVHNVAIGNDKVYIAEWNNGLYYRTIDTNGVPTGDWSAADKPTGLGSISAVLPTSNKIYLSSTSGGVYYKSHTAGVPSGNWSDADKPSTSDGIRDMAVAYSKLYIFDASDGVYYKTIDSSGVPTGNWSDADKPTGSSSVRGGFIANDKVYIIDQQDGLYYKSLNATTGVPEGDWSSADEPAGAVSSDGLTCAVYKNKVYFVDYYDGVYTKNLNSEGVPEGDWSAADKPSGSSKVRGIDVANDKIYIVTNDEGLYFRSTETLYKKTVTQTALESLKGDDASELTKGNLALSHNSRMQDGYVLVGTGLTTAPSAKPVFDKASTTETLAYDSGTQSGSDTGGTADPLDFGLADGTVVTREVLGDGYVYKINRNFTGNLRVRADSSFNLGVAFRARYATTAPTTTTIETHGTQLFSQGTTGNAASGDANIPQASAIEGAYFWFYPSATRTASNRRLRLDGSYTQEHTGIVTGGATNNVLKKTADGVAFGSVAYSEITGRPSIPVDTTIFKGAWVASTSYAVGDIVTRTNNVYMCITANSDATFTASKWEQLDVGSPTDVVSVSLSGTTLTVTTRAGTATTYTTQDTTYSSATTTSEGLVERATDTEASAGTDTTRYITPKQLKDNAGFNTDNITDQTAAVSGDGDLTLVGAVVGQGTPAYDSTADYADTNDFDGTTSFTSGSTKYVLGFKSSSTSMWVKKGTGSFTEKTSQITQQTGGVSATASVATDGTISIFVVPSDARLGYVYTYNTSNDTLSYVRSFTIGSGFYTANAVAYVKSGGISYLWYDYSVLVYRRITDEKFTSVSSPTVVSGIPSLTEIVGVGDYVYVLPSSGSTVQAFTPTGTAVPSLDFTLNSGNTDFHAVYANDSHVFVNDQTDNKFYAYKWKIPTLKKITAPQSALSGQANSTTSGTTLPSSPAVGAMFVLTATDGSNTAGLYFCSTAGTWTKA